MSTGAPFWLNFADPEDFPAVEFALRDPDGLLAVGGDLTVTRLLAAYRRGIFPWYSDDQPILWWSPDPRMVLFPEKLHLSRSLRKTLRHNRFRLTVDHDFEAVIRACAEPRPHQPGTWITPEMRAAYLRLHRTGHAHSVEAWLDGELAGGLYGVAIGRVFFGESMFTRVTDASKVAFAGFTRFLQAAGFGLIDCQVHSEHLASLGAEPIPRPRFTDLLTRLCSAPSPVTQWRRRLPETASCLSAADVPR